MWCNVLYRWKVTLLIKMQIFIVCNNLRLLIYGLLFVTHCHAGRIFGECCFFLHLSFPFCRIIFFRHCVFCWSVFVGKCVPVCHISVFAACSLVSDTHRKDAVYLRMFWCAPFGFSVSARVCEFYGYFFAHVIAIIPTKDCFHSTNILILIRIINILYIYMTFTFVRICSVYPPYSYQYRLEYKLLISNTKLTGSVAINAVNSWMNLIRDRHRQILQQQKT